MFTAVLIVVIKIVYQAFYRLNFMMSLTHFGPNPADCRTQKRKHVHELRSRLAMAAAGAPRQDARFSHNLQVDPNSQRCQYGQPLATAWIAQNDIPRRKANEAAAATTAPNRKRGDGFSGPSRLRLSR